METKNKEYVILNDAVPFYAVHPGETIREELKERGIKQKVFAKEVGMEESHLSALIHGVRNITPAVATKLEFGLGIPASLWLNLQSKYNLDSEKIKARGLSSLVDGYDAVPQPVGALAESGYATYGKKQKLLLKVPKKDAEWLSTLAERLGWDIQQL